MLSDFHKRLLQDPERSKAREAIQKAYPWYRHITSAENRQSIADHGLWTCYPDEGRCIPDDDVIALMKPGDGKIVCLHPWGTQKVRPYPDGEEIMLAVAAIDLPTRLGLDWSYGSVFDSADGHHRGFPQQTSANIFVEVVRYYGSVVSYDTVPAAVLRIWEPGLPEDDPTDWPMLVS